MKFLWDLSIWGCVRLCCCCCSVTKLGPALSDPMDYSMPGSSVANSSQSWFKFMSIDSVMLSNHLILCCPLPLLPSVFPSIKIFSSEAALHIRPPKYWSFNFSISPSNEYSGLISFRMDWFHLLAVHRILKGLLQYHSSKASIPRHSGFFMAQLS